MRSPGDARVREGDRARVRARVGRKRARDEDATDETDTLQRGKGVLQRAKKKRQSGGAAKLRILTRSDHEE